MAETMPWFGLNIDPDARNVALAFDLAAYADTAGLDLVGVQDHPYNGGLLDTWTLLSALGGRTSRVRLFPNVIDLPLRPPAMLAKAAASLDLLTGGRVELGLGAGAFWDAVAGYGGPRRSPGEAVAALEEAMMIIHRIWGQHEPTRVSFAGQFYQIEEARPGPPPAHPVGIWLGALKPRMLRLLGTQAEGWSVSHNWVPPEQIPALNTIIDQAASAAGRRPESIRRNYNLIGMILGDNETHIRPRQPGMIFGTAEEWASHLVRYVHDLQMNCFIYWPIAGDVREQARRWAEDVVPRAKMQVGKKRL